jgi:hypothetical protein
VIYELQVSTIRLRHILEQAGIRITDDVTIRLIADPVTHVIRAERVSDDDPEQGPSRQTVRPNPAYL